MVTRWVWNLAAAGVVAVTQSAAAAPDVGTKDFRIYATNEGSGDVSVIAPANGQVIATWALGKRPRGIAVSPDGRHIYVALSGSPLAPPGVEAANLPLPDKAADGIAVINARTGVIERVLRGVSDPEQLAISGDGKRLYVASEDAGKAVFLDAASGAVIAAIDVGSEPEGVAASPDGRAVYVTAEATSTLTRIDVKSHRRTGQLAVGSRPREVTFSSDGSKAYVTGEADASLTVVDPLAMKVIQVLTVQGDSPRPKGVVTTPDGHVYITTGRGGGVASFSGTPLKADGYVAVGGRPWGIAVSPDGSWLYTADGPSNDVAVLERQTLQLLRKVQVGQRPWGVAVGRVPVD